MSEGPDDMSSDSTPRDETGGPQAPRDEMGSQRRPDGERYMRDERLGEALTALPIPELSDSFYDRLLAAIAADADAARDEDLGEELSRLPVPELSEGFYARLTATLKAPSDAALEGGVVSSLDTARARASQRKAWRGWLRAAAVAASVAVVAVIGAIYALRSGPAVPSRQSGSAVAAREVPEVALLQYRIPPHLAVRDYSDRFAALATPRKAKPATRNALAVLDFESGKTSQLLKQPAHPGVDWRIGEVRVSDEWVVWQETGDTSGSPAYALYAARILDGPTLGEARLVAERRGPPPPPTASLKAAGPFTFAVSGDRVMYDVPAVSVPLPAAPAASPTPPAPTATPSSQPPASATVTPSATPSPSAAPTSTAAATPAAEAVAQGTEEVAASASDTPTPAPVTTSTANVSTAASATDAEARTGGLHPIWALVSRDLATGRVTTLATSTGRPVFTVDDDGVVLWRSRSNSFVRLDQQTGDQMSSVHVTTSPRSMVTGFAAESGWLAWIQSDTSAGNQGASGSLLVRGPDGRRYLLGAALSAPWFADGYLLYDGGDGALWAFDLAEKDAVRLGGRGARSGLLLRGEDAGRTLVAATSPSRAGVVTLYRLDPDGGSAGSPPAPAPAD